MDNQLIPQEEFQTYTSLDGTTGGSQTESPSDSGILTTRTLNINSGSNNDLDSLYGLGETSVITDYNTLLVYINELLIRFDASPKYYQKEDYRHLIKTIVDSLRYLYTNSAEINLDIETIFQHLDNIETELDTKVDKIEGKGLSTNDLTNTLKSYYDLAYQHSLLINNPHNVTIQQIGAEAAGTAQNLINNLNLGDIITHNANEFAPALTEDENYVTDLEKSNLHAPGSDNQIASDFDIKDLTDSTSLRDTWSAKQDALGFTPENVSNKKTTLTDSDNDYPTTKAVNTGLSTKSDTSHNHNLANLTERSYNSLTDLPNLSLLEDVVEINRWEEISTGGNFFGEITYDTNFKLLYSWDGVNWQQLDFHWKLYVNKDNNSDLYGKVYIYNGIELFLVPDALVLGETASTAFDGLRGLAAYNHSISVHAPSDAEKNIIIGIQKNGTDLTPDNDRKINLIVPTEPSDIGAEPANSNIQFHISDTSNPHSVTKSQIGLGNVDNTSDLAKPLSTLAINSFVSQNGGTIYHTTRWFTPTSALTIAANGLSATITSGQFTSAMTGTKLKLTGGVNEPIITYVSTNQINLSFAVDSSFFGQSVAVADWGVYQKYRIFNADGTISEYAKDGTLIQTFSTNGNCTFSRTISSSANWWSINNYLRFASTIGIGWTGTANWYDAADIGLFRNAAGIAEINNGTAGTFRDLKLRSLYADKIIPNSDTTGVVFYKADGTTIAQTSRLVSLTDSNEAIGAGSYIDLESGRSGRGSIVFGDGVGYADFIFTSAGVVTLIQYTSNVFTSVQTGTNHVIIKDNGTNVRIINEMGSTMNFNVKIQYN